MDPLTQTLLGAAAAQAVFGRRLGPAAALLGAIGGELPDIDVFLPLADPALPHEYHRHFTHSLLFIPFGDALATLPFLAFKRFRRDWKTALGAATVGCATHALLDTCTSYGTYLLWPFVNRRLAWDVISIIDPAFTLILAAAVVWALAAGSMRPARVGLALCLLYIGLGTVQHARVKSVQSRLAAERGHERQRGRVMPTMGNLVVWRSVYEADGRLYADAVRVGAGAARVKRGTSAPVITIDQVADVPRVREVFEGLRAFADGYVAPVAGQATLIGDMRYSMVTSGFDPIWGLRVELGNPHPTVRWVHFATERRGALGDLWRDVSDGQGYEPLTPDP